MQVIKKGLFIIFTILCLNNARSQDVGEWSSWKSDPVFEGLEVRYKKIDTEKDRYYYEIECRNQFPHRLSYVLVIDPLKEKANYIRLELASNEVVNVKPARSIYPKELKIYSFYASLTPSWPVNLGN